MDSGTSVEGDEEPCPAGQVLRLSAGAPPSFSTNVKCLTSVLRLKFVPDLWDSWLCQELVVAKLFWS